MTDSSTSTSHRTDWRAYLAGPIAQGPRQPLPPTAVSLADLYVPPQVQPVNAQGERDTEAKLQDLADWVQARLNAPRKQDQVLLVQGPPGSGKSSFCTWFADWVGQQAGSPWTPIRIRLSTVQTLAKEFEATLHQALIQDWPDVRPDWLSAGQERFLLILDGLDELLAVGQASGQVEAFLQQAALFQQRCQESRDPIHRVLITARSSTLQRIERWLPTNLERVELLPWTPAQQAQWLQQWAAHTGSESSESANGWPQTLASPDCPAPVQALAQDPLSLSLLSALQRQQAPDSTPDWAAFAGLTPAQARHQLGRLCLAAFGSELPHAHEFQQAEAIWQALAEAAQADTPDPDGLAAALYARLGSGELSAETVAALLGQLATLADASLSQLFQQLETFYFRWSDGEFLDAAPPTLPQQQLVRLQAQGLPVGLRHIDLYTGLNTLVLLLEIHRLAQTRPGLKEVFFYPCGRPNQNFDAARLVRLIGYSCCLESHAFGRLLGQYLPGVYLSSADLGSVDLRGLCLRGANLRGANLNSANLVGLDLHSANLVGANLANANLSDADLSGSNLWGANLRGANLRSTQFDEADLSSTDLSNAYLIRATFRGADLSDANFRGAVLWGGALNGANLSQAVLIRASLSGANLSGANLSAADFSGANLGAADLSGANLNGTDLFQANLGGANLAGVVWNSDTKWEGAKGLETARNLPASLQSDSVQDWN